VVQGESWFQTLIQRAHGERSEGREVTLSLFLSAWLSRPEKAKGRHNQRPFVEPPWEVRYERYPAL